MFSWHIWCFEGRLFVPLVVVEVLEMAQLIQREMVEKTPRIEREKALKILAKSIFRELRTQGYDAREIVSLSTELLSLITTDIKPSDSK
jgi:hypothetical protein